MPNAQSRKRNYPITVNHIGVGVDDLEHAIDWYCTILGFDLLKGPFEVHAEMPYEGSMAVDVLGERFRRMRQAHLLSGNGVGIEVFQLIDPPHERRQPSLQFWTNGYFHICLTDQDVEGTASRIAETGGRQLSKIWRIHRKVAVQKMCYCEGPFGNILEIYSHSYEETYACVVRSQRTTDGC
jgi:catechol 2,3-dioxygenase-like lactoylglutathione lyase family enzyme